MGLLDKINKPTLTPQRAGGLLDQIKPNYDKVFGNVGLAEPDDFAQFRSDPKISKKISKVEKQPVGESRKIFSGGRISDIFDFIGYTGFATSAFAKKTFGEKRSISELISDRSSFMDPELLGKYGTAGKIAGFAADIVLDPLNLVPVFGIGSKVLRVLGKGAAKTGAVARKLPLLNSTMDTVGRKLVDRYGQDPVYAKLAEKTIRDISLGAQKGIELAKPISKLGVKEQQMIAEFRKVGRIADLPEKLRTPAVAAFRELDKLGKQAVEEGLLSKQVYDENVGKYIARLYRTKEVVKEGLAKVPVGAKTKPLKIDLSRFKARKDIPEDIRTAMGEILEAGYPTAKGLVQLSQAVHRSRFFRTVSKVWGKDEALDGFKQLAKNERLGRLSGKFVPDAIYDDINEVVELMSREKKLSRQIVAGFKFGKVIMNPATHARNIISNQILNSFEGLPIWRQDIYAVAAKELARKGKWYQEAKTVGLGLDTFAANELRGLLADPTNLKITGKVMGGIQEAGQKIANLYQKEEEFAKMAQYIYQRKGGKTIEEAWKVAERATFNYAQVTPFIRKLRESLFGFPFITFTYKATPQVAKAFIQRPGTISNIGKIKRAIEQGTDIKTLEEERATESDWLRNGLYVRLPGTDKYGRPGYFDLTYIIPFGDIVGGQLFEQGADESLGQAALRKFPMFNLIGEISRNKDFFGDPIIKSGSEPEEIGLQIFEYISKQLGPPVITDAPFRAVKSYEFEQEVKKNPALADEKTTRTIEQELLRSLAGLKITNVDIENDKYFRGLEKKKRIEQILIDAGLMKKFEKAYTPKSETPTQQTPPTGRLLDRIR